VTASIISDDRHAGQFAPCGARAPR
jgi:hypothetical protein